MGELGRDVVEVPREPLSLVEKTMAPVLLDGLRLGLRDLFAPPAAPAQPPAEQRGLHRLVPRADGTPRCISCFLCAEACPTGCIEIEPGLRADDPYAPAPAAFSIDQLACIRCGLCVEACPVDALRTDTGLEPAPVRAPAGALDTLSTLLARPGKRSNGPDSPLLASTA